MRRSSHEERGLKLKMDVSKYFYRSRSSHEERGLKCYNLWLCERTTKSLLA